MRKHIMRNHVEALIALTEYYHDAKTAQDIVNKLMELEQTYDPR